MPDWTSLKNRLKHMQKHGPEFESEAEYDQLAQTGPAGDAYPTNQRCNAEGECTTAYYSPSKLLLHVLRNRDGRVVTMYRKTALTIDIEKGDTLLGGRFKNVPIVVEEIGTDDLGQPTVNGRKLLSYRIKKTMPK